MRMRISTIRINFHIIRQYCAISDICRIYPTYASMRIAKNIRMAIPNIHTCEYRTRILWKEFSKTHLQCFSYSFPLSGDEIWSFNNYRVNSLTGSVFDVKMYHLLTIIFKFTETLRKLSFIAITFQPCRDQCCFEDAQVVSKRNSCNKIPRVGLHCFGAICGKYH